jgi:hypothetical protein
MSIYIPALAFLISLAALGAASPAQAQDIPRANVDTIGIHKLYMDGEFEPAIAKLEGYLRSKDRLSHGDSVFIFKHLGVMYAATYETRERGKYYMHQLLMTEPTAKIMDMYASDMIYMIFKNIQDEFETNRAQMNGGLDRPQPPPNPAPNTKSDTHLVLWIGAATLAVGVGAFFLISALTASSGSNHNF